MLLAGLAGPGGWGTGGQPVAAQDTTASGVVERWVQVDGRGTRALCTTGDVRVLLLHDAGGDAETWLPVLRRLQGRAGACAYDRTAEDGAGDPEGEGGPGGRGWFELLDELAGIHAALTEGTPVLVGQGVGGLYTRLFALDRPADVSGLVLLEPETEGALAEMARGMPTAVWRDRVEARRRPNADGVRVDALLERARGRSLPDRPVTVVTATLRPEGTGWVPRWLNEAARRHQGSLAEGLRHGRHVPAPGSGPDLPREAPGLVADEVLRVLSLAPRGGAQRSAAATRVWHPEQVVISRP